MTDDQSKPVRSRDEQVESAYLNDGDFTLFQEFDRDDFENQLKEAEARGAAEQRQKDAENQAPSAWTWQHDHGDIGWRREFSIKEPRGDFDFVRGITPLYTHPANVAALEARIAELEAENRHQRTQILEFRNDDRRIRLAAERVCSVREGSEIFEARIALRAALTREGGV
ncbi:hypothetical protein [Gluconobacter kondonii]|uniref:hypothetical protein n=1 Tax=Gluconobacter kondonii TaxID=941463 RepID=UPI001B8CCD66|nr:hypothetical protein [Gluconobacter kondonii]MBS1079141.1 hypothetical protein [Gluconobacter kondonii]